MHDDPTLPAGCRPQEVAGLIIAFVNAFNFGNEDQLSRLVLLSGEQGGPREPWYSVVEPGATEPATDEPRVFTAYDTQALLDYVERRRQVHERLRLLAVKVSTQSGTGRFPGNVWLTFVLTRQADDLDPRRRLVQGKGAINCSQQRIWRWVMYVPREGDADAFVECPIPPDWKPEESVVACAAPET